jgi:Cys-rich protein (TIGR01571 family)
MAQPPIMVQVAAPATLPEGFQFDATFDGTTFTVTVPSGGVRQGQMFEVPFLITAGSGSGGGGSGATSGGKSTSTTSNTGAYQSTYQSGGGAAATANNDHEHAHDHDHDPHHIPRGQWRDGLFDCFNHGPCHPSFLMAFCAPVCLNGQVMTRLKLNWLGETVSNPSTSSSSSFENNNDTSSSFQSWRHTYRNVVCLMIFYFILSNILSVPSPKYEVVITDESTGQTELVNTTPPPNGVVVVLNNLINIGMCTYTILTLMRARRTIRQRYHIPEHRLVADSPLLANTGVEDCLVSAVCGMCTVAQLARHTADYNYEKPMFCTSNGLAVEDDFDDNIFEEGQGGEGEHFHHPTVVV